MDLDSKIYLFSTVWSQIKFCYANFDKVPEFNPDQEFRNELPNIIASKDIYDFIKILERFVAKAKDTHTQIIPSVRLYSELFYFTAVNLIEAEGRAWIKSVAKDLISQIPPGSELISVDDLPVNQYLENHIFPYLMTSGRMILSKGISELLRGRKNTTVKIGFRDLDGVERSATLERMSINKLNEIEFVSLPSFNSQSNFEFKQYSNNIFYIAINSFSNSDFLDAFKSCWPDIKKSKVLIVDLRFNGGGNSDYGYQLLEYVIDQEKMVGVSLIKQFVPYYEAIKEIFSPDTDDMGAYPWIRMESTIKPNEFCCKKPVYILQSRNTGSAAEDFIAAAKHYENFTTIGENTNGGTGMQIYTDLGYELTLRVCCKKDLTMSGYDYSRWGLVPDIPVERKIEDLISGRDAVLQKAIELAEKI